jgi:enoyl-CoA hydratase/carnithine racemase
VIDWTRSGAVYELALAQPPANEIGLHVLEALERFVAEVEASDARAVIVHSTLTKGFCAGADLRGLHAAIRGRAPDAYLGEVRTFIDRIHAVFDRLDALPQTTIGALHGVCLGGGFELALLCDVLIADRTTRFGFPELRLGLVPGFGGIPRLRRETPNAVVRDLLLSGRTLGAKRAHELGLVSHLVAPGEALAAARALAQQTCLFDARVAARAKAFAKPIPREELRAEKELFLELFAGPRVQAALAEFASRTDAMPYLPAQPGQEGG